MSAKEVADRLTAIAEQLRRNGELDEFATHDLSFIAKAQGREMPAGRTVNLDYYNQLSSRQKEAFTDAGYAVQTAGGGRAISRQEWEKLSAQESTDFFKSGGAVFD